MKKNTVDLLKKIENQNQTVLRAFRPGLSPGVMAVIEKNRSLTNFSSLSNISNITKSISQQLRSFDTSMLLGHGIQSQIAALQFPKNYASLFGLNSVLTQIAKTNQLIPERLSDLLASQFSVSNNLAAFATTLNQSHLNKFNSIQIALQGISKSYLKDIAFTRNWDDISVAVEANEAISHITDDVLSNTSEVTPADLDNLRQSIVEELYKLLGKTKTDKARQFIFELISIFSFLLIFYNPFVIPTDKSNSEVIAASKKEIEKISAEFSDKFETILNRLGKTRTARTAVNLRFSEKKNSKVLGLVKTGQQVTVIEIRHRHLLISYIDSATGEPKSGFVSKKYFDVEQ